MSEMMKKYEDLVEKAKIIANVGKKIADLIEGNNSSINWYQSYMQEKIADNPDYDIRWELESMEELRKENVMLMEVEKTFWQKHVF